MAAPALEKTAPVIGDEAAVVNVADGPTEPLRRLDLAQTADPARTFRTMREGAELVIASNVGLLVVSLVEAIEDGLDAAAKFTARPGRRPLHHP